MSCGPCSVLCVSFACSKMEKAPLSGLGPRSTQSWTRRRYCTKRNDLFFDLRGCSFRWHWVCIDVGAVFQRFLHLAPQSGLQLPDPSHPTFTRSQISHPGCPRTPQGLSPGKDSATPDPPPARQEGSPLSLGAGTGARHSRCPRHASSIPPALRSRVTRQRSEGDPG